MNKKQKILLSTLIPTTIVVVTATITPVSVYSYNKKKEDKIKQERIAKYEIMKSKIEDPSLLTLKNPIPKLDLKPIKTFELSTLKNSSNNTNYDDLYKEINNILETKAKKIDGYYRLVWTYIFNFESDNKELDSKELEKEFLTRFLKSKKISIIYLPNNFLDKLNIFNENDKEISVNEKINSFFYKPYENNLDVIVPFHKILFKKMFRHGDISEEELERRKRYYEVEYDINSQIINDKIFTLVFLLQGGIDGPINLKIAYKQWYSDDFNDYGYWSPDFENNTIFEYEFE
ncbi:hypothetical protein FJO69_02655 [[Mycoplasma] falconis]|uniref:Uncharacterized protein n=1 Tax=[Mycoplasma] falconis TaxID=92403 RepID=A0A501X8Q8_9BACT|nr:hypothetical protein [[Mycoplasma] falconis]TPE56921.1 hypothetical protein FJO69_02655 [[Mycoplasma] falconis]